MKVTLYFTGFTITFTVFAVSVKNRRKNISNRPESR